MIRIDEPEALRLSCDHRSFRVMDKLGMQSVSKRLISRLFYKNEEVESVYSTSIGIVSEAGTGKSFLLNLFYVDILKKREEAWNKGQEPNFNCLYIDIANYQHIDNVFLVIVAMLIDNFDDGKRVKDFFGSLFDITNSILNVLPQVVPGLEESKKLLSFLKGFASTKNVTYDSYIDSTTLTYRLKEILCMDKKIVVIVDNLEKCSPEYVVKFFYQMKRILDLEQYTFILSYDKQEIETSLRSFYGNKFKTQSFFRKYIFHEFYIDRFYDNIDGLLKDTINSIGFEEDSDLTNENIIYIIKNVYKTYNGQASKTLTVRILLIMLQKFLLEIKHDKRFYNSCRKYKTLLELVILKFVNEKCYEMFYEKVLSDSSYDTSVANCRYRDIVLAAIDTAWGTSCQEENNDEMYKTIIKRLELSCI